MRWMNLQKKNWANTFRKWILHFNFKIEWKKREKLIKLAMIELQICQRTKFAWNQNKTLIWNRSSFIPIDSFASICPTENMYAFGQFVNAPINYLHNKHNDSSMKRKKNRYGARLIAFTYLVFIVCVFDLKWFQRVHSIDPFVRSHKICFVPMEF